jgi:RNA polymerase sigma factor (sigma-70 family)
VDGRPQTEGDLIARARAGDGTAFGQLVQKYQELAFRTAYLITIDATDAEDAAQEGFMRAYQTLRRFRPDAAFRPWLLQIVANAAKKPRRAAGRRVGRELRAADANTWAAAGPSPSPEVVVIAAEQRRTMLSLVNGLSEEDRMAIACRYFLGLTEAESASVMGCAPGTVKSRLSRALQRLRQQVERSTAVEFVRG